VLAIAAASGSSPALLPNGWELNPPAPPVVQTGTMPQGAAISADGTTLAVVESGYNPPALALYATSDLHLIRRFALKGAFGRPVWVGQRVLVAGANADAILVIDTRAGTIRSIALPRGSYPIAVAASHGIVAVANDGNGTVIAGKLATIHSARPVRVGAQLGPLTFSRDGMRIFVAVLSGSDVASIDIRSRALTRIRTDLHPSDVLIAGRTLYVAQSDADTVGEYDSVSGKRLANVFVGAVPNSIGSSPNSLAMQDGTLFVSLGAANEVAELLGTRVTARLPAGWYPTAALPLGSRLFVVDGKGEGTKPNPAFDVFSRSDRDYIAAIQFGSIRELSLVPPASLSPNPQGAVNAGAPPPQTIVRSGGPIRHVFFILKENRSYDQILGDMPNGDGDPKLTFFGRRVTPNQHAIAERFGLFDNFYTSGEVSDSGHNWSDGAFANDYVERMWPSIYGGRNADDETNTGIGAGVPAEGYIWDAARRAGVSFRDYGEMALMPAVEQHPPTTAPSLKGRFDPHYVGWNLDYSDLDRYKEWKREFDAFVATDTLPQFEYLWVPNDHTYGTRPGKLAPASLIAQNDYAVGLIVDAISHSKVWGSSAIFVIEDDSQDGADHVSGQRTTFYLASPYAVGGTIHEHYATVSILRTIELLLGMKPLSNYDATAAPLYAAFGNTPNLASFDAIAPQVDLTIRNSKVAYGAGKSVTLDFSRPDTAPAGVMAQILSRAKR
jgi:DNA-binding beta-propeller fold protein YncE